MPGELVQEQRERHVQADGEDSSPTDLIRSMALSSAELWHDVLKRLSEVQEGQRVLARAVAELGALVQTTLLEPGAARVLAAAPTAELASGATPVTDSNETAAETGSNETVAAEPEAEPVTAPERRRGRRWRRRHQSDVAESSASEIVDAETELAAEVELAAEALAEVELAVEHLAEVEPTTEPLAEVELAVEPLAEVELAAEDAAGEAATPEEEPRRGRRWRRRHRRAEGAESSASEIVDTETALAADGQSGEQGVAAVVEVAQVADIESDDAAEAAPEPKRRRGRRWRRRHQAETDENPTADAFDGATADDSAVEYDDYDEPTGEVPVFEFAEAPPPPPPLPAPPWVGAEGVDASPDAEVPVSPVGEIPGSADPSAPQPFVYEPARPQPAAAAEVAPQPIAYVPAESADAPFELDPPQPAGLHVPAGETPASPGATQGVPQPIVYIPSTAETVVLRGEPAVQFQAVPAPPFGQATPLPVVEQETPLPAVEQVAPAFEAAPHRAVEEAQLQPAPLESSDDKQFLRPARPASEVVELATEVLGTSLPPAAVDDQVGQPLELVISEDVTLLSKRRRRRRRH